MPTKKPVKVINIADVFPNPSLNNVEGGSEEVVDYASRNELDEQLLDNDTPPVPLLAVALLEESLTSQEDV